MSAELKPSRPPIILCIDSQEWSLRSFESVIGPRGYAVARSYTGRQGLELLAAVRPDAVLVAGHLADMTVLQFLEALRASPARSPSLPVLVASAGPYAQAARLELLRAGAWAVIAPPVDGETVLAQLDVFVAAKREVDRVHEASLVDEETGFYSHRGLARRARELAADAYRRSAPLACIVVAPSLDSGTGTLLEEQLAGQLADALRRVSRTSDLVGRVGRTEFAIVACADASSGIQAFIARLQAALAVETPLAGALAGVLTDRSFGLRVGLAQVPNYREATLPVDDMLQRATWSLHAGAPSATLPS